MQTSPAAMARRGALVPWARMGDESLARQAAKGNDGAFTALYERYYGPLLGYTRSILLDVEDARDATQAALENALRALPRREPELALRPWLYRIAHNEAIAIVRRRRPQTELVTALEPTAPGPDVDAEQRGRLEQLVDDLRSLPDRQRGALVMRELSGLSYEEIGAALGMSVQASRRAVFDARSSLHDAADGRATECISVRHRISDGDRRGLRARSIRAHLRCCDDCASFSRAIDARRNDLHALTPWLSGAAVASALGGGALLTGGASMTSATIGWAGMPVAIKGVAVAAAVATTGTAAVEIKQAAEPDRRAAVTRSVTPRSQSAGAATMRAATHAARSAARTARVDRARSVQASTERTRAERPQAARRSRSGDGTRGSDGGPDGGPTSPPRTPPVAPLTGAAQTVPAVATPRSSSPPAETPRQQALRKLRPLTERVQKALLQARTIAANGTQGALAAAGGLLDRTLTPLLAGVNRILAPLGIKLPSVDGASTSQGSQTGILGQVRKLLGGAQNLLQRLLARP